MADIGRNCHELRIDDGGLTWRILYHLDSDAVVILEIFQKKSRTTPKAAIEVARKRLRLYQRATQERLL
jgi:phage-related protein